MKNKLSTLSYFFIASFLFFSCNRSSQNKKEHQPQYNIISILVDDWGWTDLGCYGGDLYETPNIDKLASEGVKFTNAYSSCTVCSPTRASLMTGKYPARLHLTDWIKGHEQPAAKMKIPNWTMYLSPKETIIPEVLKEKKYKTIHIGKWHLGEEEEYYPHNQGFDINIAGYNKGQPPSYFYPYYRKNWGSLPYLEGGKEGEYLTDREAEEACKFIKENKNEPFYINLAHYAVHTPIQAKETYIKEYKAKIKEGMRHKNAIYAAMIKSVDESLGKIMATLKETGLSDKTIILITGDNGGLKGVTDNYPLRAGKGSAYEGGVRVPFIVKAPKIAKAGVICDEPVMTIDIYPTYLDIAKVKGNSEHNKNVDGKSLVSLLKNPQKTLDRKAIYWHYPHYHPGGATPYSAIRMGDYKLIEFLEDNRYELYNLRDDIGETKNISLELPNKVKEMYTNLEFWRKNVDAQYPTVNPNFDLEKNKTWLKRIYVNQ